MHGLLWWMELYTDGSAHPSYDRSTSKSCTTSWKLIMHRISLSKRWHVGTVPSYKEADVCLLVDSPAKSSRGLKVCSYSGWAVVRLLSVSWSFLSSVWCSLLWPTYSPDVRPALSFQPGQVSLLWTDKENRRLWHYKNQLWNTEDN